MSSSVPSCLAILDASETIAGRYCARLFAKLGARVERRVRREDSPIGYRRAAGLAFGRWVDKGKLLRGTVIVGRDSAVILSGRAEQSPPAARYRFDGRRLFTTQPASRLGEHDQAVFASVAGETCR